MLKNKNNLIEYMVGLKNRGRKDILILKRADEMKYNKYNLNLVMLLLSRPLQLNILHILLATSISTSKTVQYALSHRSLPLSRPPRLVNTPHLILLWLCLLLPDWWPAARSNRVSLFTLLWRFSRGRPKAAICNFTSSLPCISS